MTYCSQLLDVNANTVDIHDRVSFVLESMDKSHINFIPVLNGLEYMGMISEADLLDADANAEVISLVRYFIKPYVRTGDHFLLALKARARFHVDYVPVLNEKNEWEGVIGIETLLNQTTSLIGIEGIGSMLVLELSKQDFALGEINRLVESNDGVILQMNTIQDQLTDTMQLILRINKEEISDIVATFQRHEYRVIYYYGEESYSNALQSNLDHLLNYLNI